MKRRAQSYHKDLWKWIDKTSFCWTWMGRKDKLGYGRMAIGSNRNGTLRSFLVHRFIYETLKSIVPDGKELDHLCRNTSCVNPDHLELVTHRENMLRGNTIIKVNAEKTHCMKGHSFNGTNTYLKKDGSRNCRQCHADEEYRRRRRLSLLKNVRIRSRRMDV